MIESSPASKGLTPSLPATAGVKRPAPTLLPAFEPLSSSPALPRPTKRQATASNNAARQQYPTPVPTSTTGILSSSPPRARTRPVLQRTQSVVSERAPLSDVPSVELNDNGDTLLMGRSSNSSHYQLSADRLVSRIHVRARYIAAAAPLEPNRVEIVCSGWNGLGLHCQGRTWELAKGDTFTSETEGADIMIDVQGARVMVHWPRRSGEREALAELSDSSWDNSPRQRQADASGLGLQGSPLRRSRRIESPESPTPANHSGTGLGLSTGLTTGLTTLVEESVEQLPTVEIYEDASAEEAEPTQKKTDGAAGQSFLTEVTNSFSSDLSEPQSEDDAENNPDEENDPIIMSFGPFGANLTNRMTAFPSFSPKLPGVARMPSASSAAQASLALGIVTESKEETTSIKSEDKDATPTPTGPAPLPAHINKEAVTNHVINQLAFSRLSSNPLSGILNNLPSEEKRDLTTEHLRVILDAVPCVGSIKREGKDAAGKLLESEYFYEPDKDDDSGRRAAVVEGLRKPSLRNCRKQHKQYYWKRPRTP